jgi:cytochrome c oxidase assembly protein subunit 15
MASPIKNETIDLNGKSSLPAAIVVTGFGLAVATWVAAFVTHIPALNLDPAISGPIVLTCWALAAAGAGRLLPRTDARSVVRSGVIGGAAGLLSAVLGLLILGAQIAKSPTGPDGLPAPGFEGLRPSAGAAAGGFLAAGLVIGLVGVLVGSRLGRRSDRADWRFRMTLVCAVAVIPLVITGGAVTSTNSGLAIRGWPDSYGANMFLYPIALMSHPAVFLEHTHRLFGTLVGLTTLVTAALVFRNEPRAWVKRWAAVLFVLVCVQGVLGGLRVRLGIEVGSRPGQLFALFHGVLAQLFFAGVVALSAYVSPAYRALADGPSPAPLRKYKALATGALHALWVQLVLGAIYRHFHDMHALVTHAVFSLVVMGLVTGAAFAGRAVERTLDAGLLPARPAVSRVSATMLLVVALQFLLGWAALGAVLASPARDVLPPGPEGLASMPAIPWWEAAITTAHQANGALVLAATTLGFVWSRRLWRAGR